MRRFAETVFDGAELEQIERVAAWRGRRAAWEIADELRRQLGRGLAVSVPLSEGDLVDERDPADIAATRELVERLLARVAALGPRLRFITERRLAGYTLTETAAELGCTVPNVSVLWRRAVDGIIAPVTPKPNPPQVEPLDAAEIAAVRPFAEVERETIEAALRATRGDVAHAANLLRLGKATIYRRLDAWGTTGGTYARQNQARRPLDD